MHLGSVLVGILIGFACGLLIGWLGGRVRRGSRESQRFRGGLLRRTGGRTGGRVITPSPPLPQEERTSPATSPAMSPASAPAPSPAAAAAATGPPPPPSSETPTQTGEQPERLVVPGILETGAPPAPEEPRSDPDRELVARLRATNRRLSADARRLSRTAPEDWRAEETEAESSSRPQGQPPQSSAGDLLEWSQKLAEDARRRLARESDPGTG